MNPQLAATLANAASNVAGSIIGAGSASNLNKKNRQWQEQQNTVAYERQQEMQRQQNDWSAAQAQIERDWNSYANQSALMEEAGINPAVMYGWNGSSAVGMSTSNNAPDASTGSVDSYSLNTPTRSGGSVLAESLGSAVPQMVAVMGSIEQLRALQIENRRNSIKAGQEVLDNVYYSDERFNKHERDDMDTVERAYQVRGGMVDDQYLVPGIVKDRERQDAEIENLKQLSKTQITLQSLNAELAVSEGSKRAKIAKEIELLEKDVKNYWLRHVEVFGGAVRDLGIAYGAIKK